MPLTPAEMEAAASFTIMFILVGAAVFAAVGGVAFWLLDRRSSSVSDEPPAEITSSRAHGARVVRTLDEAPSNALDGRSDAPPSAPSDGEPWEPEEVLRQLATIKIRRKDGTIGYLSKERMAALVGMRAEEARAIVNAERGEPPPDGLRVKDRQGERVISRVA